MPKYAIYLRNPPKRPNIVLNKERSVIRCIDDIPDDYICPQVYSSPVLPYEKKLIEAVGEHYEALLDRYYGIYDDYDDDDDSGGNGNSNCEDFSVSKEDENKFRLHKSIMKKPTKDLYELLGLGNLRYLATQEEIRQSYRKIALIYHPDKFDGNDEMFKAITSAYNDLSDPQKRMEYDSNDPFDDEIPSASSIKLDEDFFDKFGTAFRLNSKWSKIKPVPDLGTIDDPIGVVNNFYKFWMNFDSWRRFSSANEYNPSEAETGKERKWMERENYKKQGEKRKAEYARIMKLVQIAMNLDPRIRLHKEKNRLEKERYKREKENKIKLIQDDIEKKEKEKRERDEQEKRERKAAEDALINMRKQKERLSQELLEYVRKIKVDMNPVYQLLEVISLEELKILLDNKGDNFEKEVLCRLEKYNNSIKNKVEEKQKVSQKIEKYDISVWTKKEIQFLTKALVRYPPGSLNRWKLISEYIGGTKTEKEIIDRVKRAQGKELKERPKLEDSYQKFLSETQAKNTPVIHDNCENKVNEIQKSQTQCKSQQSTGPKDDSSNAAANNDLPNISNWTNSDQIFFEAALKKYPVSTTNRWEAIASEVPGKSKKDCIERFKYLVNIIKSKRNNLN